MDLVVRDMDAAAATDPTENTRGHRKREEVARPTAILEDCVIVQDRRGLSTLWVSRTVICRRLRRDKTSIDMLNSGLRASKSMIARR